MLPIQMNRETMSMNTMEARDKEMKEKDDIKSTFTLASDQEVRGDDVLVDCYSRFPILMAQKHI
jgi:hypothetical protein